jgi:hypothetical protein
MEPSDFEVFIKNRLDRRLEVLAAKKKKQKEIAERNSWAYSSKFDYEKLEEEIDEVEGEIIEILLQEKRYNKGE